MVTKPLTISEALRFANHDFLNQLHLIQMNLDLQRVDEAKQVIQQVAEHCKMLSNVNKLGLPKTVEWLQTFHWRFPALQVELNSHVTERANEVLDEVLVQYLENTIIHIYDHLDPFTEQQLQLAIESNAEQLTVALQFSGKWEASQFNKELQYFDVQTEQQTAECWKFVLRTNEE